MVESESLDVEAGHMFKQVILGYVCALLVSNVGFLIWCWLRVRDRLSIKDSLRALLRRPAAHCGFSTW